MSFSLIILRIGLGMSVDETIFSGHFIDVSKSRDRKLTVLLPMKTLKIAVTESTDVHAQPDACQSSIELDESKDRDDSITMVASCIDDIEDRPVV